MERSQLVKPGLFSVGVAADSRRGEFDFGNESLVLQGMRPDFVFIGDSITHLWELQAYFGGTGKVLINRGIGGDVSTFVRKRFEADVIQLQPKCVVMKIGTNDLGWALEQLSPAISEVIFENDSAMLDRAKAAGITMALCSILPVWGPSWYPSDEFSKLKNAQIVALNARLKQLAEEKGAIWVDYHSQMVGEDGQLRPELADDGVHPHHFGYAIMADVLRKTFSEHSVTI